MTAYSTPSWKRSHCASSGNTVSAATPDVTPYSRETLAPPLDHVNNLLWTALIESIVL
jgi:hypothetical protein